MKNSKNPIILISVLTIIALLSGVILGFANSITAGVIAENEVKATNAALQAVMPNADTFDIVESGDESLVLYEFKQNGTLVGVAGIISTSGFGGEVRIMVGVDALTGVVTSAQVLSHSETPGLGARIAEDGFISQFDNKNVNDSFTIGSDVTAITGATISSKAATGGIRSAVESILSLYQIGGN